MVLAAKGEILQDQAPTDLANGQLEAARTYVKLGDAGRAREQYEELLQVWHDGDDSAIRQHIVSELKAVNHSATAKRVGN